MQLFLLLRPSWVGGPHELEARVSRGPFYHPNYDPVLWTWLWNLKNIYEKCNIILKLYMILSFPRLYNLIFIFKELLWKLNTLNMKLYLHVYVWQMRVVKLRFMASPLSVAGGELWGHLSHYLLGIG